MNVLHAVQAAPRGLRGGFGFLAWTVVATVVAVSSAAFGDPLPTSYIYGIDDSSQLWVMGLSGTDAGTSQSLLQISLTASSANGLAYDKVREQLFAADTTTKELFWWQQGATSFTSLGSISAYTSAVGSPVSAAYYDDAYWFLGDGAPGNTLTKVPLTYTGGTPTLGTGTIYTIADMPTTASGGGDMVITPAGMLYAYSASGAGNFFSVDLTTIASGTVGGYTVILNKDNNPNNYPLGLQLALGTDDTTLYGSSGGNWFVVDKSTGSTTPVSGLSTPGFRDLGGSSIQAVPEPSTMVLAAMGLGIVAWQATRRRTSRHAGGAGHADAGPVVLLT